MLSQLVSLLTVASTVRSSFCLQSSDTRLIGWKGETYLPHDAHEPPDLIETVSLHPRAYFHHSFLSDEEAEHVIRLAAPFMKRSEVQGRNGNEVVNGRSSLGTFIWKRHDSIIAGIEAKVAEWTGLPIDNQEIMQVLRYEGPQRYAEHSDIIGGIEQINNPRVATVIMYLSSVKGGETVFPRTVVEEPAQALNVSECASGHKYVGAKKGGALFFTSLHANGSVDETSSHAGCPVTEGVKWVATLWIHSTPYASTKKILDKKLLPVLNDPADCRDIKKSSCADRMKAGECETRPGYMLGRDQSTVGEVGHCRLTCKACEVCQKADVACRIRNRERAGFVTVPEAQIAVYSGIFPWSTTNADYGKTTNVLTFALGLAIACLVL